MEKGDLSDLKYDAAGLIPAVVQDFDTGAVLMVAWMNRKSLEMTIDSGYTHFWSRSRKQFWKKGETSGHTQKVREIRADCDGDTLLVQVEQTGPACHTNRYSCFFRTLKGLEGKGPAGAAILEAVYRVILERKEGGAEGSYVAGLLGEGREKIVSKIREEAGEVAGAAGSGDAAALTHEVADLWFHTLVLLGSESLPPEKVFAELGRRFRPGEPGGGRAE